MKSIYIVLLLALFSLAGCSTASNGIGAKGVQLKAGHVYALKRNAILLANRGTIDSIENPDYAISAICS